MVAPGDLVRLREYTSLTLRHIDEPYTYLPGTNIKTNDVAIVIAVSRLSLDDTNTDTIVDVLVVTNKLRVGWVSGKALQRT